MKHSHLFKTHNKLDLHYVMCVKCKLHIYSSRHVAINRLNSIVKNEKKSWKSREFLRKEYLSYKDYVNYHIVFYKRKNIIYSINYKQRIVKTIYCDYSDDEFNVRSIIE